jgi:hypothetical protein
VGRERHADDPGVVRLRRDPRLDPREGAHGGGAAVRAREALEGDVAPGGRRQQRVHRGVVAARPRRGEVAGGVAPRVLAARADDNARGEGDGRRREEWREPQPRDATAPAPARPCRTED